MSELLTITAEYAREHTQAPVITYKSRKEIFAYVNNKIFERCKTHKRYLDIIIWNDWPKAFVDDLVRALQRNGFKTRISGDYFMLDINWE